ncbi:hypothetical protein NEHOM01_0445 [Nematocida homosporus]|uniref:uncharacterized protein n=1 Tax=Nematocida homosporus TaxID=1912981 RepID=UPI002220E59D|nr:uncharacterized protein NEHOM01_0445 [Nematocida homosporus]KAI5184894.1 hypothetical protein NEHOM01_0445 [Nematocida homosporus]
MKEPVRLSLKDLSVSRLKGFGRFFKREFDAIYHKDEVLRELGWVNGGGKELVKTCLYLADRPEIVAELLPYLFKGHIFPDGCKYVKEVVKVLARTGTRMFISDESVLGEMRGFFTACKESLELLWLVEDGCRTCPRAMAGLLSEEYLVYISEQYPARALQVLEALENSGVEVVTTRAREVLHTAGLKNGCTVYRSSDGLGFFF